MLDSRFRENDSMKVRNPTPPMKGYVRSMAPGARNQNKTKID